MTKKKQQLPKKTHSTYRPKFAFRPKKIRRVDVDEGLLRHPATIEKSLKVSTKLPDEYNMLGNSAYFFPPKIVVTVLLIIIFVIMFLLF